MIHYLFTSSDIFPYVNIFKYITFRSGMAAFTSLMLSLVLGPYFIAKLKSIGKYGQPIRKDGPAAHIKTKSGTPTMGGILILFSMVVSVLLWADLSNPYIWIILFVTCSLGFLGFVDDYLKLSEQSVKGVPGKLKLIYQTIVSIIACFAIQKFSIPEYETSITIPFLKSTVVNLGYFYVVFVTLVIVGSSNAVNLTDGLDGLAIVPVAIVAMCLGIICYLVGNFIFARYLQLHFVPQVWEVTVLCAAIVGSSLGFLWFNAHPAKIFMGDVGSLALGGAIGTISVIAKQELVLLILGGLFAIEAISVILQVYYFKFSGGKRLFLMAPIHHHFEKKGWTETQVVIRFWIIAVIFALIALSTLKIR